MKNVSKCLLLAIIMLTSFTSFGQARETMREMSQGIQNALILEVSPSTEKMAKNTWEDYIKKFGKTKRNKKFDEWFTDNASVTSINETGSTDIYMQINQAGNTTTFYLFADAGAGFISKEKGVAQYTGASKFLYDFGVVYRKAIVNDDLKKEKEKKEDLDDQKKKLIRTNEKLHKEITEAKELISENEKKIEQNIKDQEKNKMDIEGQIKIIDGVMKKLSEIN
ncbi:MAG: hypothetical protein IPO14_13570 [Saprospiraceae bacterium]|nr:hypothetical protein [Saprospiraceae bacterium]